jgi:hypothetical protein
VTNKSEPDLTVSLTPEQKAAFEQVIEQFKQRERGFIGEASVRIKMLWGFYLILLYEQSDVAGNPKRPTKKTVPAKKGVSTKERRKVWKILKDHIGRKPTAADLKASFASDIEVSDSILEVVSRDLDLVSQPIKRRTRMEVLMDRVEKLMEQQNKRTKSSSKKTSKKAGKKKRTI